MTNDPEIWRLAVLFVTEHGGDALDLVRACMQCIPDLSEGDLLRLEATMSAVGSLLATRCGRGHRMN